jgi:bifunctional non-homologous end joining protein LigD
VHQDNNVIKAGKYQVAITNPDRLLFPKSKICKQDLIDYYQDIAPTMLPYLKNRPISMQRFPEGIDKQGFFQKDAPDYFPEFIQRTLIGKEGGHVNYVMVNNAATLIYLANSACIAIHPWLSTIKSLDCPDRIIFDLDPSGKDFGLVRKTALLFKDFLEGLGLVPFVMTTGSRGLHVTVPIKPEKDFDEVRNFAREIGDVLIVRYPEFLTGEIRKDKRAGKIFVDYLRNGFGQTGVSPYSVRAHEKAPVATPLEWPEVKSASLRSDKYTINNIFKRLATVGDPWQDMKKSARSISKAQKKLEKMKE